MSDVLDPVRPPSGRQIVQLQKDATAALQKAVDQIGVQMKALEMAISVCRDRPTEVMALARLMRDFLLEPARVSLENKLDD